LITNLGCVSMSEPAILLKAWWRTFSLVAVCTRSWQRHLLHCPHHLPAGHLSFSERPLLPMLQWEVPANSSALQQRSEGAGGGAHQEGARSKAQPAGDPGPGLCASPHAAVPGSCSAPHHRAPDQLPTIPQSVQPGGYGPGVLPSSHLV